MTKISDNGIIININKYNDKCYKVIIFSENNGLIQTFLKKDRKNKYLIYDLVSFECDNIGQFNYRNLELKHIKSYWNNIYSNKLFLSISNSISFITISLMLERGDCGKIYNIFHKNIYELNDEKKEDDIFLNYINFLKEIVIFFGFNLDMQNCSVSGANSTYYISPKTGNCISKEVGEKYKDKLFVIPRCFLNIYAGTNDFKNGLFILFYFLKKIFMENGKKDKVQYLKFLVFDSLLYNSSYFSFE